MNNLLPSHLTFQNGQLRVEEVSLEEIVQKIHSPVYVYSKAAILDAFHSLTRGLAPENHTLCFAVKSNSNLAILDLLKRAGAGMDIVSGGELYRAGKIRLSGNDILFSGVGKTTREILDAVHYQGQGIYAFVVECPEELEVLDEIGKRVGRKISFALRFNPDINARTHPYISTGLKKNKFGIPKADVLSIAKSLKRFPNLEMRGLSVHIGSQLTKLGPIEQALKNLVSVAKKVEKISKTRLSFLDVGGGLGIQYLNEKPPSAKEYTTLIKKYLCSPRGLGHSVRIMLEPGRFIVGNAGLLITQILYKKRNHNKNFLVVDAAMTDLIRPALYQSYHQIIPVREGFLRGKKLTADVVGPVCESSDFLAQNRRVSAQLKRGDLIAILSAGAYGFSMSSHYNSRPKPAEVLVDGSRFQVIRQRENYDALTFGEAFYESRV